MEGTETSFFERLKLAFKVLFDGALAGVVKKQIGPPESVAAPAKPTLPPERVHASGLGLLAALQREGRMVDFLQQEVASFSDEEVGAAARVVHAGCRKVMLQYLTLEPATKESEGAMLHLPAGFDAQRFRLTGNVTGQPPYRGTLKHHGWLATEIRWPAYSEALDPKVIAPAEVELP